MSDIYQAFFVALFTYLKIWGTLIFKKKFFYGKTLLKICLCIAGPYGTTRWRYFYSNQSSFY